MREMPLKSAYCKRLAKLIQMGLSGYGDGHCDPIGQVVEK